MEIEPSGEGKTVMPHNHNYRPEFRRSADCSFLLSVRSGAFGLVLIFLTTGCIQHCKEARQLPPVAFSNFSTGSLAHFQVLKASPPREWAKPAPPIIMLHELPGMYDPFLRFATNLSAQGYTVYLPVLFGKPGDDKTFWNSAQLTFNPFRVARWHCFRAGETAPIVADLKTLCYEVGLRHPGEKMGVVGMCLTGSFPLALMSETQVQAVVVCQPATPVWNWNASRKADLGLSPEDIAVAVRASQARNIPVFGVRFELDTVANGEKFKHLRGLFGLSFLDYTIRRPEYFDESGKRILDAKAHSVFAGCFVGSTNHPTFQRFQDLCHYLDAQLK